MNNVEARVNEYRETSIKWSPGGGKEKYVVTIRNGDILQFPEKIAADDAKKDPKGFIEFAEQVDAALGR